MGNVGAAQMPLNEDDKNYIKNNIFKAMDECSNKVIL